MRAEENFDPADQITTFTLTAEEEKTCRQDFEKLASDDFDTREKALNRLVSRGPAVLPLAQEFSKHADTEIATQAKSLHQRMVLNYDGYLPTAAALRDALSKKIEYSLHSRENLLDSLRKIAKDAGIELFIDPHIGAGEVMPLIELQNEQELPATGTAQHAIDLVLQLSGGLAGLPRGKEFLVTTQETARRLMTQRHTFDWSHLGLNRAEAERVAQLLTPFFPPVATELHTGPEPFIIRGEEEAIRRAARMISLLKPGAPDAIYPRTVDAAESTKSLIEMLSTPATLILNDEDPTNAIAYLKKQNLQVFCIAQDGEPKQSPPYGRDIGGAAPLRLALHDLPLGLVLRWLERRAKFPAAEQSELLLGYEIAPSTRVQLRLQPKSQPALATQLCGADVTFLYPRGAKVGAESDAAAKKLFLETIDSHLALFPRFSAVRDIAIVRGRLFMQGNYGTLARTLDLIREWRAKGAPPAPAAWKASLDSRLNASVDWDGRGLGGGKLLQTLRKLGKMDILLEDAPDGSAPSFQLTAKDAELLPPGKHTIRELLDSLTKKAHAIWTIDMGVVVLTPKADRKN